MPAVVPEASVARAQAQASGTGLRSHAGADESPSPFAGLLEGCETSNTGAAEAVAPTVSAPPESGLVEPALWQNAMDTPKVADAPKGANAPTGEQETIELSAELMLVIATAGQPAVCESKEALPAGAVAADQGVLDEAQADGDTPKQQANTAAVTDIIVAVAPAPVLVAPPLPAPIPATDESAGSIPAPTPVRVGETPIADIVPPSDAPLAVAPAGGPPGVPLADVPLSRPAAEVSAPTGEAAEIPVSPVSADKEKVPRPEKPAPAIAAIRADEKTTAPVIAEAARQAMAPVQDADPSEQKVSVAWSDAPAPKANGGDGKTPDAKPNTGAAQPAPEALAHAPAFSAPFVPHIASNYMTQPSMPQPGPPDAIPVAGLAVAIAAHAEAGKSRFDIRLDPPELGRIDVRLDVDSNGQVTSHLRVERAETLDLLRRDAPALERALQEAGLKTSDSGLQFSLRNQSSFQQKQEADLPAMAHVVAPDDQPLPAETQRHYGRHAGPGSGVDIRV